MKKIILILGFAIATSLSMAQQPPKNVVYDANAQVRNVSGFTSIKIGGGISLYLSQGSADAVAVSTGDNKEVDKIKTEVKDGVLRIFSENNSWNSWTGSSKRIKAYVTIKNLEKLDLSGASSANITDKISTNNLKLDISGASSLKGEFAATNLKLSLTGASNFKGSVNCSGQIKVDISGASSLTLAGAANEANIELSGASVLKGSGLVVDNYNIGASGASSASIAVKTKLKADASGASSIRYAGDPATKEVETSGASSIKRQDN